MTIDSSLSVISLQEIQVSTDKRHSTFVRNMMKQRKEFWNKI